MNLNFAPFGAATPLTLAVNSMPQNLLVMETEQRFETFCLNNKSKAVVKTNLNNQSIVENGINLHFTASVAGIVKLETLFAMHDLAAYFGQFATRPIDIVVVPHLLAPAKFMATGGVTMKPDDCKNAAKEVGLLTRAHTGFDPDRPLMFLGVALPFEASERTDERRFALATRTATQVPSAHAEKGVLSLATPDDYLAYQIVRAMLMLNQCPYRIAPSSGGGFHNATCGLVSTYYYTNGSQFSWGGITDFKLPFESGSIGVYKFSAVTTAADGVLSKRSLLEGAQLEKYLRQDQSAETAATRAFSNASEKAFDRLRTDDLQHAQDTLKSAYDELTATMLKMHHDAVKIDGAVQAQVVRDLLSMPYRFVEAVREAYDPSGVISAASVLWAEGKPSTRFGAK
jgi:hypothetical protein